MLVKDVAIGLDQGFAETEVDLLLAEARLSLAALDGDAALAEMAPDRTDQVLLLGPLEDVVILVVEAHRAEIVIALLSRRAVAVVEDVELDLRTGHDRVAGLARPRELALQHAARRDLDRLLVMIEQVAQHESGARQPGGEAQGAEVGPAQEVAKAGLPTGVAVTFDDIHLHVAGEQVVTGMHAARRHLLEEVRSGEALSHQAAVHVREHRQHGLDLALVDEAAQLLQGQHAARRLVVHRLVVLVNHRYPAAMNTLFHSL